MEQLEEIPLMTMLHYEKAFLITIANPVYLSAGKDDVLLHTGF